MSSAKAFTFNCYNSLTNMAIFFLCFYILLLLSLNAVGAAGTTIPLGARVVMLVSHASRLLPQWILGTAVLWRTCHVDCKRLRTTRAAFSSAAAVFPTRQKAHPDFARDGLLLSTENQRDSHWNAVMFALSLIALHGLVFGVGLDEPKVICSK